MFITIGAVLGFLGVAAGAFGAHGLKEVLSPDMLAVYETAVRYQMCHALALVLTGVARPRLRPRLATAAGIAFLAGVVVFSGSLYALALTGVKWLGAVTPLGGAAFLAGWFLLAASARPGAPGLDGTSPAP